MDESSNAWVCPQILQYTRTTERERILSASWISAFIRAMTDETAGVTADT
ncbi:MAG: hypothetical protein ACLS7X_17480 [Mediterraneibacter gnavus]